MDNNNNNHSHSSGRKQPLLRPTDHSSYTGQPPRSSSARYSSSSVIIFVALLLLGLAGIVLLLSAASSLQAAVPSSSSSSTASAHPEHLVETLQQLTHNQQLMFELLRASAANNKTSAASGSAHTTAPTQQASVAAAAAAAKPGDEQQREAGKQAVALPAFAALPALTTLHNEVLRASHGYGQHRRVMLDTLQQLVHLEPAAADALIDSKLKPGGSDAMTQFTCQLYKLLLSTGKLIPCREDSTLELSDADDAAEGAADQQEPTKYYFATNLRDNSFNMPQYILSLLQTLLRLPLGSTFVSAYESNSDDGAHGWVDVLQLALNVIGTPSRLVTRGMLVRVDGSHRIQHLARVRNMALAPLYQHYAAARDAPSTASGSSSSDTDDARPLFATPQMQALASEEDAANLPPGVLPWDPDYIVFVNDVFFCWGQVIRLTKHKADITCGMDYWQNRDATVSLRQRNKAHKPKPDFPEEIKLERPIDSPAGSDQHNPIVFYDIWVARDLSGSKFWWEHPFVQDRGTRDAAEKGLPFRASCCWNGLAVLKAAPFKAGLRIRHAMSNECQASECTIVCNDFARLGYDNVVVDAGVQITYDWSLAREMSALGIEGVGQTTWAEAKAAGIAGSDRKPNYHHMECCDLKGKWVNFYSDCHPSNTLAINFTHAVLHG